VLPVRPNDDIWSTLANEFASVGKIMRIDLLKNETLEKLYKSQCEMIAKTNGGSPNERYLFHGTTKEGADGILHHGFDNHFYKASGAFGAGAYFADGTFERMLKCSASSIV
jgi:hypothetical protein